MTSRSSSSRGRGKGNKTKSTMDVSISSKGKEISIPQAGLSSARHQPGSFTQQQSGSSTQIQPQPKQTKADYEIPIQTLLAFHDIGLNKLPKKTWASIADDDNDQDLPTLQTLIQNQKSQALQISPKPIQPTSTKQEYIKKTNSKFIMIIEPDYQEHPTNEPFPPFAYRIASRVFPPNSHLAPISHNKTQTFYEFILIDTDSVSIKHFRDQKDESLITHSTFQILNVLKPSDFGNNPNKTRKFSKNFDPIGFNYWDYVRAWDFTILGLQNKNLKHSWLVYFKKATKYSFPNWFHSWWDFFGPTADIFPSDVLEGFNLFSKNWNKDLNRYPICLNFYSIFSLSWVFSWQYDIKNKNLPELHKRALIKWWNKFDASMVSTESINLWFRTHQKFLGHANPQTSLLLNQKAHISAALAGASSEDELVKSLNIALQLLQDKSRESQSSSSKDPLLQKKEHRIPSQSESDSSFVPDSLEDSDEDLL